MYDIHCHLLPAIDDGAQNEQMALAMAKQAEQDGISHIICTPHIYPNLYENTAAGIAAACEQFKRQLKQAGLNIELSFGADIQVQPELVTDLQSGRLPTLNQSRYFLFEPPHHVPLPQLEQLVFNALATGYIPIITHPERLTWIADDYDRFVQIADQGAWIQITAGSLIGAFGKTIQYWAEKMMADGIVHIIATDAHNLSSRPLMLSPAKEKAIHLVGKEEAIRLVQDRPAAVWHNLSPKAVIAPPRWNKQFAIQKKGFWSKLLGR